MIILWLVEREQLKQTPPSCPSHSQGVWCSVSQCYTSLWLMVGLKETIKNVWWQADNLTQLFLIFQFLMLFGCQGLTKINDRRSSVTRCCSCCSTSAWWPAGDRRPLLPPAAEIYLTKKSPRINWLFLHSSFLLAAVNHEARLQQDHGWTLETNNGPRALFVSS